MSKPGRESLFKLKTLVEELGDRDEGLKRDASLFEAVFRDFPIPVTIWLTDEKGLCVSRRVSGRDSRGWSSPPPPLKPVEPVVMKVIDMYQCVELKKEIEKNLKIALKGKQLSFMSFVEGSHIWSRLTPRYLEDGTCIGVIGVSWDLTANYRMFNTLLKISSSDCGLCDPEMDLLKAEAKSAANGSVIKSLLEESAK